MNIDALSSSQNLAEVLALPGHTPAALEPFLKHAVEKQMLLCATFDTADLGQRFSDFSDESLCLAVAVPDSNVLDWAAQLTDWVIPFCEVNHSDRTTRELVMLGDGPVAVPTHAIYPVLVGVDKVLVVFSTQQGTLAAAYTWNEKFLATVEAVDIAAKRYEFDEYKSARAIAIGKPISGCSDAPALVPMPVTLEDNDTARPHEERQVHVYPFSSCDLEYAEV